MNQMVSISCSGKLHAFALAEQISQRDILDIFYTTYASEKNTILKHLAKRLDKEKIPKEKISTASGIAFPLKLWPSYSYRWNNIFDKWVAGKLSGSKSKIFIGWSGMSLQSIRAAKKLGMITIVERGSSHIMVQDKILREEYRKFGIEFSVPQAIQKKEMDEYREADFISIPSYFVRDSFLEQGIEPGKLFMNPYGTSAGFNMAGQDIKRNEQRKFRILYVGSISVRKGLIYLFEALSKLNIPDHEYEVWFIGEAEPALKSAIQKNTKSNWKWWGRIDHYKLPEYIRQCDVGVQPSLEEGLSMVIPQIMGCGIPVIASTHSGGSNIIFDGVNGFIVPIRDPAAIAKKIEFLFFQPDSLKLMKEKAGSSVRTGFTWNDYGDRYARFLEEILPLNISKHGSQ
jgi:glycosyltransferase involved in cell wall biosynthesis